MNTPVGKFDASAFVWLAWFASFVVLEVLGLWDRVPWFTLSQFVWGAEDQWGIFRWIVLFGLAILLVHLVARWP